MIEKLTSIGYKLTIHDYTLKNNLVYLHHKPVIILFSAIWCSPCQALYPLIEKISEEYFNDIDIYKIDIDYEDSTEIVNFYKLRSVPTLLFINLKGETNMKSGSCSEKELKSNILEYFNIQ